MLQVMVTVGALHDKQSQEPSWIMEPLNCFSSELCQTAVGCPSSPWTQGQIVPILLSSQRAQHEDRNGGKERLKEGKKRGVEKRHSRKIERPAHGNYRGGKQKPPGYSLSQLSPPVRSGRTWSCS